MRTRFRVGLAAVLLGLIGCAAPGKKADSTNQASVPFTGTALPRATRDPASPPPEVDNLLAGQVLERAFKHRVANASIQVVDLEDPNPAPAARLDVSANSDGYFFIPGLQRGHHYRLVARVKDGDALLSGTTLAMPPNPRLSIVLSEDLASPLTPAPLAPPVPPSRPTGDKDAAPPAPEPTPKVKPDGLNSGAAPQPPLNRIADGPAPETGGFQKVPVPPKVEIPYGTPNPIIPPPPRISPSPPPPADMPPVDQASHVGPPARAAPPFCVLVGNRLDNFSLPTLEGQTWEFRRDPPRKLVLLDFWKSNCPPCLAAIKHLRALQEKYGPDGLEVVGAAYEDPAPPQQQAMNVRNARARCGINYTILMANDTRANPCPLRSQFLVDSFPRLVLIDESGEILWRSSPDGLSDQALRELEEEIYRKFHPPAR